MMRVRLFTDARHPVKAWRVKEGEGWSVAREVVHYIQFDVTEDVDLTITVDKVVTGQEHSITLDRQYWQEKVSERNSPILWEIKDAVEAVERGRDIVQERINRGRIN